MAIGFVQQSSVGTASGTSVALSFSPGTTLGNGIVVLIETDGALAEILAPTDNFGNTYTKAAEKTNASALSCSVWYTSNSGSSISTVTCNFNSSQTIRAVAVEVRDGAIYDTSSSAAVNSDTPAPGSITTAVPDEIIFALLRSSGTISATPSGYTTISEADSPAKDFRYKEVSSITSANPTWSLSSSAPHAVMVVSFKASNIYTANSYPPPIFKTRISPRVPQQLWAVLCRQFSPPPPEPVVPLPITLPISFAPPLFGPWVRYKAVSSGTHPPPVVIGPQIEPRAIVLHPSHPIRRLGNGALFGIRPVKSPDPSGGVAPKVAKIERVPRGSDAERLRRSTDQMAAIFNSLIGKGVLKFKGTVNGEPVWDIDVT